MRKALAILAVCCLASTAFGLDFYATRGAAINRAGGEEYASGGAMSQARIAKYRQHYHLLDFDWAAIKAYADTLAAPVYELSIKSADDRLNGIVARIVISSNDVDWVEGDGNSQFTNFSWTNPTVNPAVTSQYAQTYEDALNPGNPDLAQCIGPWPWGDFDAMRSRAGFFDTGGIVMGLAGVRSYEPLDQWFMDQIFSGLDIDNRPIHGIYTYDKNGVGSNGEAYLSDAGQADSPFIRVTPEPATLMLVAVGGVAMLLRKKR
jgi:hypothetical protein